MLSEFMLPSTGAFTIDGTIIIAVGVIAAIGILVKYKENIRFTNEDILINKEENTINNIRYARVEENNNLKVSSEENITDEMKMNEKSEEKVKLFN